MKVLTLVLITLLLTSCYPVMTNEEIIREHAKCDAVDLGSVQLVDGFSNRTVAVECRPKKRADK